MSNLRQTIEIQAVEFASAVVNALRSASLDELMNITSGGQPRRAAPAAAPRKTNGAAAAAPKARRGRPARAGRPGRLGRRSAEDIAKVLEQIVGVLAQNPEGLRSEQIQSALQLDKKEMPRPLAEGLSSGRLSKKGNKRATTYFVAEGGGAKKRGPKSKK